MSALLVTIGAFLVHPYAVPLWGALSALVLHGVGIWKEKSKNKIEEKKVDVTEYQGNRQQDREDFQVIKDSLYNEINRMKATQVETLKLLEESDEETKKCEQRYFELATQYRELLKYCATLSRKIRELESEMKTKTLTNRTNDQTRTNHKTTGSSE